MDSCKTLELFNNCGDLLSSTDIKDEPKEEPEKFSEREPKLPVIEHEQAKFKHRFGYEGNTSLQNMREHSQQCSKQEDPIIKHEIQPDLQFVVPAKIDSKEYHDVELERSCSKNGLSSEADSILPSSDTTFCSETLREKYDLEHLRSHSLSDFCVKEKTVNNQESDFNFHKCMFTFSRQNDVIDHDIKRDFPLVQDVSVKAKFCQGCNKSLYIYMCEICKRAFTDETLIESHMSSHAREHTYECEVCHKSFSAKKYLRNHIIIHTGKRPYSCSVCDKSFNHNSNLLRHMHLHSTERPFKCEYCYKTFVVKGELRFHIRTHTGERPYQCDVCSKTYLRKNSLDIHMQIHDAKQYKCEICGKCFFRRAYLYNHMYIHSGASPNSCEVCNKSFTTRSSLVRHKLNYCIPKSDK